MIGNRFLRTVAINSSFANHRPATNRYNGTGGMKPLPHTCSALPVVSGSALRFALGIAEAGFFPSIFNQRQALRKSRCKKVLSTS